MERIIIALTGERIRQKSLGLLNAEGWGGTVCASGAEVIRTARRQDGAVVLCGFYLPDMTADTLAAELRGTAVVLVMAKAVYLDLCGGENLYKLPLPTSRAEFLSSLRMLLNLESLYLCHPASRRGEEERTLIRRAKELLMDVNRMTEEEAHRFLQKRSMDEGIRMDQAARYIIGSYDL
jgi:response regulator NasT